jgi:hypothetical protein
MNALLDYSNPPSTLGNYAFASMFSDCTNIVNVDKISLPASVMGAYCYYSLFNNTRITTAPVLPSMTLASYCYGAMFMKCSSLTTAPLLPATILVESCYYHMFEDCKSLATAPLLHSQTLAIYCYHNMFYGCDSLITAPNLPALNVPSGAYRMMFRECHNLINPPIISAVTIDSFAFEYMFNACTSLTTAPTLLVTNLTTGCYRGMYQSCTNLINAPALPLTTLAQNCYYDMFWQCISLVNAPALPAASLVDGCYARMFYGCTNLVNASGNSVYTNKTPEQEGMFTGCTNVLTSIPYCEIPVSFGGPVTSTCPYLVITNSTSVTPKWTTIGDALQYRLGDGAWTNATSGNSITTGNIIRFRGTGRTSLYTSATTNNTWVVNGSNVNISGNMNALLDYNNPPLSIGDYAFAYMFNGRTNIITAGILLPATTLGNNCYYYMFNGCTNLTNIVSILPAYTLSNDCYNRMFGGCTSLISMPTLPATTLADGCYQDMFNGCTNLINIVSILPVMTLRNNCYQSMFSGCRNLTTAPELPATTLAQSCYNNMFSGCTGLTEAPNLLATSLVDGCYTNMFNGCTNLITVPNCNIYTRYSPAQGGMFTNDTNITTPIPYCEISGSFGGDDGNSCQYITINNATSVTPKWTTTGDPLRYKIGDSEWLDATSGAAITTYNNVIRFKGTSNRTSLYDSNNVTNAWTLIGTNITVSGNLNYLLNNQTPPTTIGDYAFNNMFNGCTNLIKAPKLPATGLGNYCYTGMFKGCTKLTNTPSLPAGTLKTGCYSNMFQGCTSITVTPILDSTPISNCYDYMFSGCTNLTTATDNWYVLYSPAQTGMFQGCTKIVNMYAYCEIPTGFGGPGTPCPYLIFDGVTDITPKITKAVSGYTFQYRKTNSTSWISVNSGTTITTNGYRIRFRGTGLNGLFDTFGVSNRWVYTTTGSGVNIIGNINTLLNYNNPPTTIDANAFAYMFYGWAWVYDLSSLILPATTLGNSCYAWMFKDCVRLETAPNLPATSLSNDCYNTMFSDCTKLINAPGSNVYTAKTPAQTDMFKNCTVLTTPLRYCAITVTWGGSGTCMTFGLVNTTNVTPKWSTDGEPLEYSFDGDEWFNSVSGEAISTDGKPINFRGHGRTSLYTSSDESNAWVIEGDDVIITGDFNTLLDYEGSVIIGENAFAYLFYKNESITTVNATLPSTVLAERCYYSMFRGCTNLLEAPNLPATKLVKYCYYYMFMNCTSLTEAPGANRYMDYIPSQGAMFGNCKALLKPISFQKITDNWK